MGRHVPQRGRAAAARLRAAHRPVGGLHCARSRRRRGLDGHRAPRAGAVGHPQPVPAQGHLPGHLFARGQQPGAAGRGAAPGVPVVRSLGGRAQAPVPGLCAGQAGAERARLRRPAAVLGRDDARRGAGRRRRRALRPYPGRRVPGHQPPAGRHPAGHEARRRRPDRGGRRRAVDLFVPRRERAQHPRFPAAVSRRRQGGHAGAQLPLHPAHPGCVQRGHRAGRRTLRQSAVDRSCLVAAPRAGERQRRSRPGALGGRPGAGAARGRGHAQVAGGAVSRLQPQRRAGAGADPAQHPVREIRRPALSRGPGWPVSGWRSWCPASARPPPAS
ncbi:Uncharacterised protein [Bordetella pertussis]|nr:Uncharacterised protein [Bordetella pertussis]